MLPEEVKMLNNTTQIIEIPPENQLNSTNWRSKKIIFFIGGVILIFLITGFVFYFFNNNSEKIENTTTSERDLKSTTGFYVKTTLSLDSTTISPKIVISPDENAISFQTIRAIILSESPSTTEFIEYDSEFDYDTTISPFSTYSSHRNFHKFSNKCGDIKTVLKIQGGNKAKLFEHPWIVTMQYEDKRNNTGSYFCGGSIISENLILTAAHCIKDPRFFNV